MEASALPQRALSAEEPRKGTQDPWGSPETPARGFCAPSTPLLVSGAATQLTPDQVELVPGLEEAQTLVSLLHSEEQSRRDTIGGVLLPRSSGASLQPLL